MIDDDMNMAQVELDEICNETARRNADVIDKIIRLLRNKGYGCTTTDNLEHVVATVVSSYENLDKIRQDVRDLTMGLD